MGYGAGMTGTAAIAILVNGLLGVAYQKWWPSQWWPKYMDPYTAAGMVRPKSLRNGQQTGNRSIGNKWGGTLNPIPNLLEDLRPIESDVLQDSIKTGHITKH